MNFFQFFISIFIIQGIFGERKSGVCVKILKLIYVRANILDMMQGGQQREEEEEAAEAGLGILLYRGER